MARNIRQYRHYRPLAYRDRAGFRKRGALCHARQQPRTGAAKGDLIIIRSGDIHYCDVHSPDLRLEFLIFSPEVLKSSMRGIPPAAGFLPAKLMSGAGLSRDWDVLMRCIDEELAVQGMYYSECVRLMITAFYCRLLRKLPVPDFQAVRGYRLCGVLKSA